MGKPGRLIMKKILLAILVAGLLLVAILTSESRADQGDMIMEGSSKTFIIPCTDCVSGVSNVSVAGIYVIDSTIQSPLSLTGKNLVTLFSNDLPSGSTFYVTEVIVAADDSDVNVDIFAGASQYARSKSGATTVVVQGAVTGTTPYAGVGLSATVLTGVTPIPAGLPIYADFTDAADAPDEVTIRIKGYLVTGD